MWRTLEDEIAEVEKRINTLALNSFTEEPTERLVQRILKLLEYKAKLIKRLSWKEKLDLESKQIYELAQQGVHPEAIAAQMHLTVRTIYRKLSLIKEDFYGRD